MKNSIGYQMYKDLSSLVFHEPISVFSRCFPSYLIFYYQEFSIEIKTHKLNSTKINILLKISWENLKYPTQFFKNIHVNNVEKTSFVTWNWMFLKNVHFLFSINFAFVFVFEFQLFKFYKENLLTLPLNFIKFVFL